MRDLVTQMHAYKAKPDTAFCTTVAKLLMKMYPFMKDVGQNVSGYVRHYILHVAMCVNGIVHLANIVYRHLVPFTPLAGDCVCVCLWEWYLEKGREVERGLNNKNLNKM